MNVVIIMTDQQAASSLPMYGNPVVRTPRLAELARAGCLFEQFHCSCPLCVPSRVSLFTGQVPSAHGSLDNGILMGPGKNHLLRRLKRAGYACGLAGKNHCFQGEDLELFDRIDACGHYGPDDSDPLYREPKHWIRDCRDLKGCWGSTVNPYPPERLGTHWTSDRAIDFVREAAGRNEQFFLWYSIADPHIPFQTPEPYASMYPPDTVDLPVWLDGEMDAKPRAQRIDRAVMAGEQVDEATVRKIRSIYYGMNSFIDDQVGRFLDELDAMDLADETLVVYLSDHGEYLGEHRMIRKSKSAYDCLTHVPMIVRGPGVRPGRRCRAMATHEDVAPTILTMLGLETPAEMQGRDLSGLLDGSADEAGWDCIYGEYGNYIEPVEAERDFKVCASPFSADFHPKMKLGGMGRMRYIREDRWKLVLYVDDVGELYDLHNDPHELHNLYGLADYADPQARLTARLAERMIRLANPGIQPESLS